MENTSLIKSFIYLCARLSNLTQYMYIYYLIIYYYSKRLQIIISNINMYLLRDLSCKIMHTSIE